MPGKYGDFDFTEDELNALFADDEQDNTPPAENTDGTQQGSATDSETEDKGNPETTKAFAKRLAEKSAKAVADEREAIAKKLGYESYELMMQANEKKLLESKGLDPDQASPVIDELVRKRIDNDPRMKELEELRKVKVQEFAKKELAEITKLTNGAVTSLNQIPKPVIELWKTTGSLKAAYLQIEGENLIAKARSEQSQGSTAHMQTPSSGNTPVPVNKRLLTDQEKAAWKIFYPNMSAEELNKMTVDK